MSEHIHEQISAFLDDELSSEESAFLVRRLTSDALAHRQTIRYAMIGSVLRDESPLANSTVLRDRIHAVLDGAPVAQGAARPQSGRQARWARMLAGASVAASVAVVALLGLRTITETPSAPARTATNASGTWTEPNSYVVPGASAAAATVVAAPIHLTNLMIQHGPFASNLHRTAVQSNVISEPEPESESAEQAADEVQGQ